MFGGIKYRRAYYVCQGEGANFFPLDEKLGIDKRHTPGFNYFMTSFTGQGPYEKSMDRFHEIFRPDGAERVSLKHWIWTVSWEIDLRSCSSKR